MQKNTLHALIYMKCPEKANLLKRKVVQSVLGHECERKLTANDLTTRDHVGAMKMF